VVGVLGYVSFFFLLAEFFVGQNAKLQLFLVLTLA
jgi:hypothetical protein